MPVRHQVARFLIVGALVYLIDVTILWFCVERVGLRIAVGTTIAYAVAFVVNFSLGRQWVFPNTGRAHQQLMRFLALVAVNYLFTLVGVIALTNAGLGLIAAKTCVVIVAAITNFFVGRHWVYV